MKLSEETLKLITPEQLERLPGLVHRLENVFAFAKTTQGQAPIRIYEGVKYVVHAAYAMQVDPAFIAPLMKAMEADGYFSGTVFGKPETVFFFMPLFT